MVYLTDNITKFLADVKGIGLFHNIPTAAGIVKRLLKTEPWTSFIYSEYVAERLSKLLKCKIPLQEEDTVRLRQDDRIIYVRPGGKSGRMLDLLLITVDLYVEDDRVKDIRFS
jgi:hypothetical protein